MYKRTGSDPCSAQSRKVGLVCHSMLGGRGGDYEVKIFVVDIDLQPSHPCGTILNYTPAVRFRFPPRQSLMAVCVLNLTVYLFGGYNSRSPLFSDKMPQSAHRFVLSQDQINCQVNAEQLREISIMHYNKGWPKAIPSPDGKRIMVFGTHFNVKDSFKAFELYDPLSDSWEQFPGFPLPSSTDEVVRVTSYSFIGNSRFFVLIDKGFGQSLAFGLDLEKKVWAKLSVPKLGLSGYFVTAKDRYVLAPGQAFDFGYRGRTLSGSVDWSMFRRGVPCSFSTFAPNNLPDWGRHYGFPCVVPLEQVGNTCVLQVQVQADGKEARVLLDICETHPGTLTTTVRKCVSLRIVIPDHFYALDLISI